MQYGTLGASGLLVSPVCLGTMTFGTPVSEADSIRLVHEAIAPRHSTHEMARTK